MLGVWVGLGVTAILLGLAVWAALRRATEASGVDELRVSGLDWWDTAGLTLDEGEHDPRTDPTGRRWVVEGVWRLAARAVVAVGLGLVAGVWAAASWGSAGLGGSGGADGQGRHQSLALVVVDVSPSMGAWVGDGQGRRGERVLDGLLRRASGGLVQNERVAVIAVGDSRDGVGWRWVTRGGGSGESPAEGRAALSGLVAAGVGHGAGQAGQQGWWGASRPAVQGLADVAGAARFAVGAVADAENSQDGLRVLVVTDGQATQWVGSGGLARGVEWLLPGEAAGLGNVSMVSAGWRRTAGGRVGWLRDLDRAGTDGVPDEEASAVGGSAAVIDAVVKNAGGEIWSGKVSVEGVVMGGGLRVLGEEAVVLGAGEERRVSVTVGTAWDGRQGGGVWVGLRAEATAAGWGDVGLGRTLGGGGGWRANALEADDELWLPAGEGLSSVGTVGVVSGGGAEADRLVSALRAAGYGVVRGGGAQLSAVLEGVGRSDDGVAGGHRGGVVWASWAGLRGASTEGLAGLERWVRGGGALVVFGVEGEDPRLGGWLPWAPGARRVSPEAVGARDSGLRWGRMTGLGLEGFGARERAGLRGLAYERGWSGSLAADGADETARGWVWWGGGGVAVGERGLGRGRVVGMGFGFEESWGGMAGSPVLAAWVAGVMGELGGVGVSGEMNEGAVGGVGVVGVVVGLGPESDLQRLGESALRSLAVRPGSGVGVAEAEAGEWLGQGWSDGAQRWPWLGWVGWGCVLVGMGVEYLGGWGAALRRKGAA